jgi:hypothetical protein
MVPPQIPAVAPGGIAHGRPGQQSDVDVQVEPCARHCPTVPQMNAGVVPFGFGMQGAPQ